VAVALAKALSTLCGPTLGKHELAELASYVEIQKLGMPIGRQDQYAAAFGGLNAIYFDAAGVRVEPLHLVAEIERALARRILLFYPGASRAAASILRDQNAASGLKTGPTISSLHQIKELAIETIARLRQGDLDGFGDLLHESWQAKKRLAKGISNPRIDEWYELARAQGARGGKIAGAGGGGFLMVYCEEGKQEALTAALEAQGPVRMDFHFERGGAVVLMDAVPRIRKFGAPERVLADLGVAGVRGG